MIQFNGVSKHYHGLRTTTALNNMSLQIDRGEFVSIVGPLDQTNAKGLVIPSRSASISLKCCWLKPEYRQYAANYRYWDAVSQCRIHGWNFLERTSNLRVKRNSLPKYSGLMRNGPSRSSALPRPPSVPLPLYSDRPRLRIHEFLQIRSKFNS